MVRSAASRAALNASQVSLIGEGTRGDGGIEGGGGLAGGGGGDGGGNGEGGGTLQTVSSKLSHHRPNFCTCPEQH